MKQMVEDLEGAEPSLSDIGATVAESYPQGFTTTATRWSLAGAKDIQRAVAGIKTWKAPGYPVWGSFPMTG